MLESVRRTVLGDALSRDSRDQLTEWLLANETGDARLRAGVPKGWRVGDKTGTASHGVTNDIGVAWSPSGEPVVVVAYYAESTASVEVRSAVLAEVARIVIAP
jgi:beta-lactamase class A